MSDGFHRFASSTAEIAGRSRTFLVAVAVLIAWACSGPLFRFSDTWQLVINTGTTIITFLMVFLIQNTQNRDMSALHLKLDELIRVNKEAHNKLLNLEDLTEEELAELKENFTRLAAVDPDLDGQRGRDYDDAKEEIGPANAYAPAQVEHRGPSARRDRHPADV